MLRKRTIHPVFCVLSGLLHAMNILCARSTNNSVWCIYSVNNSHIRHRTYSECTNMGKKYYVALTEQCVNGLLFLIYRTGHGLFLLFLLLLIFAF